MKYILPILILCCYAAMIGFGVYHFIMDNISLVDLSVIVLSPAVLPVWIYIFGDKEEDEFVPPITKWK